MTSINFGWGSFPVVSHDPDWEEKYPLLDHRVRFILSQYAIYLHRCAQGSMVLTDFDTPGIHLTSCHYDHRGVDAGIRGIGLARAELFGEWINGNLNYGYAGYYPVVVGRFDKNKKHDDHIHIQVPAPYRLEGTITLR